MKYISTRGHNTRYSFDEIIRQGIPDDGGLFVPETIPTLPEDYYEKITQKTFHEIALDIAGLFIDEDIVPRDVLKKIINDAFNFPLPLKNISSSLGIFELFHGPTGAFKDFGARFMAQILSYLQSKKSEKVTIVTATSGDTGAAVASAFHNVNHVEVFILYPKGRVSNFQEKQITGLGNNIHALEIKGTFDDCQELVKNCFNDHHFKNELNLTSSNSVNFSRLIPQIIYYFEAYRQARVLGHENISFIVPSGNFGNLTGGVYAKKMGMPVKKLIAATNANDVFPNYVESGIYEPGNVSKHTISNAMDVANPSNMERIFFIYRSTWNNIVHDINSNSIDDEITRLTISHFYKKNKYLADPHTAVGISNYNLENVYHGNTYFVVLSTAHPYKFKEVIHEILPDVEIEKNNFIREYERTEIKKIHFNKDLDAIKEYIRKTVE